MNLKDLESEVAPILNSLNLLELILSNKTGENFIGNSAEAISVIQRIAKNYPNHILSLYDRLDLNGYLKRLLGSSDRKKVIAVLKIIEEWVKAYKSESLIAGEPGGEAGNESDEEETKGGIISKSERGKTPYDIQSFCQMMNFIVGEMLSEK